MLALALAGCANGVGSYDPVAWWHHLEGGQIAENRPRPPGINAPYPNLATIPSRPEALSAKTRAEAASRLLQDQENGAYALAQPVPAPPPAPTPPPAPAAGAMGGQMAAVGESQPAAAAPAVTAPAPAASAPVAEAAGDAALSIPARPPPPPDLPGVPWLTRPAPLPQAPPIPPAPPLGGIGKPVAVRFARGSAVLSPDDEAALKRLAAARAASVVAVTGFGEAPGHEPGIQVAALRLAWARAEAIAAVLRRDGVPDNAMSVAAYGPGGGGVARLVPAG